MSTAVGGSRARAGSARPAARQRPPARATRSRLRAVTPPTVRPRSSAFVTVLVLLLASGMIGLLVLNTAMQRSAFQLETLRDRAAALDVRTQVLDMQLEKLRSPDRLARQATGLGMVPVTTPGFVDPEGQVLGKPLPAIGGAGPQLVRVPPAPTIAEPTRAPAEPSRPASRGRADRRDTDTPRETRSQRDRVNQGESQRARQGQQSQRRSAGRDAGQR